MKYVIAVIIVILVIYIISIFNKLTKLKNKVREAFSTMDVYLKKRWDLIPNLVEIVKGYSAYEKGTLEEITNIRSRAYDSLSNEQKIKSDETIKESVIKIIALAESYPELKANEHFMDLANQLTRVENEIANSRKYYNAVVRDYNNKVEMFPSNIIAGLLGYKSEKMFIADVSEKNNIKIDYTKEN